MLLIRGATMIQGLSNKQNILIEISSKALLIFPAALTAIAKLVSSLKNQRTPQKVKVTQYWPYQIKNNDKFSKIAEQFPYKINWKESLLLFKERNSLVYVKNPLYSSTSLNYF